MSDQVFNVNAGFFNSVDEDRKYYAEDMNKPYKRLVSNGVFATPQGTPSTDLKASAAGGMVINVAPGQGIFADKWFENTEIIPITVPANGSTTTRIDSVIAQIDTRISGRAGYIVYRTGTAAASPVPPVINAVSGVIEYRLANIAVNPGASAILQGNINDRRGSDECPWITALINQVDTSALFDQYESAYEEYFETSTAAFDEYRAEQEADWAEFIQTLTDDLTVSTNVIALRSTYNTTGTVSNVPVGIPSYNPVTDVLLVYINGLLADSSKYSYVSSTNQIRLVSPLSAGQMVNFVVFKSVIGGDLSTVSTLIQQLNQRISAIDNDSGWINLTLQNGAQTDPDKYPAVRCIGNRVYLRGSFIGGSIGSVIATLPAAYKPAKSHYLTTCAYNGTSVQSGVLIEVNNSGQIVIKAAMGAISGEIPISTDYSI